ncbi:MAG: glycerol-3-phosphate 1-O-acyltransferase PlsY, partial [Clostridia bacterium]|nr:glycerol-3-phosphate 1-O-acyltransferase PlsY [Clostridia bacterium]
MMVAVFGTVIAAYLIGSINFAVIFSKKFMKKDIRELGSGNAGSTNMLRSVGVVPGLLTFICDALKGAVACGLGKAVFSYYAQTADSVWILPLTGAYLCGIACMVGHVYPAFFGFKGGKGVATSVGIYAICCPPAIVIGLLFFTVVVFLTRYVSLGSILAAVLVVSLSLFLYRGEGFFPLCAACSLAMGLLIIVKHRGNMVRLFNHTESK